MKNDAKRPTLSLSSAAINVGATPIPKKTAKDEPPAAEYTGQKIDRPGFDLGGSTGDTHAGTGLGLGKDAFDTPGERRLPGRRLDNDLTIPRWGGPEPRDPTSPDKKTAGAETPAKPETKKAR